MKIKHQILLELLNNPIFFDYSNSKKFLKSDVLTDFEISDVDYFSKKLFYTIDIIYNNNNKFKFNKNEYQNFTECVYITFSDVTCFWIL